MNIKSRLKKTESRIIKKDGVEVIWDLSRATTEQLLNLKSLIISDEAEAVKYTQKLVDGEFISYRINE